MKDRTSYNYPDSPVANYYPSVFVIGSPFQAMCAVEAIRELEIEDYVLYAVMGRNPRDSQTKGVLDYFKTKYVVIDKYRDIYPYMKRLAILKSKHNRFHRAFVGGYGSMHHYYFAMRNISDGSVILTLDDGVETISLLKDSNLPKPAKKLSFINNILLWVAKHKRRIDLRKKIYTIYSDIQNSNFIIFPNTLSHLYNNLVENNAEGVFFAGTIHSSCIQMGISECDYFELLRLIFTWISNQFSDEKKVYIPHGTDSDPRLYDFCKEFHFEYIKPMHNIELYLCNQSTPPKVVIGFTSSCLLNLKRMFPNMECINIIVEVNGSVRNEYQAITDYYERNNISTMRYLFPEKVLF